MDWLTVNNMIIEQLTKVLKITEEELGKLNSPWTKTQLIEVVRPEMEELYEHFSVGDRYFKYGSKQRMLNSTYLMTESMGKLNKTKLGLEISKLQEIYNHL